MEISCGIGTPLSFFHFLDSFFYPFLPDSPLRIITDEVVHVSDISSCWERIPWEIILEKEDR